MFEFNKSDITGTTNRLLYNILQELKRLNEPAPEPTRLVAKATKEKANGTVVTCKKCGKQFENRGKFFQHMKGHKKEE